MVIMLAILESSRSGWLSLLTKKFEENTEDEDAAIVELVAATIVELVAAIVSVTDGSDTMKIFDTHREYRELQRKLNEEEKQKRR